MIPRPFCLSLKKTSLRTTPQGTPAGQGQLPWSSKHQVPTEDSILRPNLIWILFFSNTYIHIYILYIYIHVLVFPIVWVFSNHANEDDHSSSRPGDCRTPGCLCSTHTPGRGGSAKAAISIFCLIKGRKPPPPVGCCRDQVFPHLFFGQVELITPRCFTENHNGFYWKIKGSTAFLM